jgi:surfactin synthase thioesterase subunit
VSVRISVDPAALLGQWSLGGLDAFSIWLSRQRQGMYVYNVEFCSEAAPHNYARLKTEGTDTARCEDGRRMEVAGTVCSSGRWC